MKTLNSKSFENNMRQKHGTHWRLGQGKDQNWYVMPMVVMHLTCTNVEGYHTSRQSTLCLGCGALIPKQFKGAVLIEETSILLS